MAALKRKKLHEQALVATQGQMTTVEQQIHSIETANLNAEMLRVMKDAGKAMKEIHQGMDIDKVEQTMYVFAWFLGIWKGVGGVGGGENIFYDEISWTSS